MHSGCGQRGASGGLTGDGGGDKMTVRVSEMFAEGKRERVLVLMKPLREYILVISMYFFCCGVAVSGLRLCSLPDIVSLHILKPDEQGLMKPVNLTTWIKLLNSNV